MAGLKGIQAAYRELTRLEARSKKAVQVGAMRVAKRIAEDAAANVPVDLGAIKNSIGTEQTETGAKVFVGAPHAAFQEFGTGVQIAVPAELAEDARQFQGYQSGNFEQFVEDIRGWCTRHGISESAAFPIAAAILRRGLKPQPFFYPAILKHKGDVVVEVQKELDKIK